MITPSPPSGLLAPNALKKVDTESPGSSVALAAPSGSGGDVHRLLAGLLDGRFRDQNHRNSR